MSIYCKHLDINFDPLQDMTYLDMFIKHTYGKYRLDPSIASNEMKQFLATNSIPYYEIELFCCPENYVMPPHCDDEYFGNYCKINFAYSKDTNHTMDWYSVNSNWDESQRKIYTQYQNQETNDNPAHYWFKQDEVTMIHQETIKVAQVNVGIPHGVTTNSSRMCVSFIPFDRDGNEITMDYVLQTP
jgi:hypothetical protein